MNGMELLALSGTALTAAVTTLASVALWHRRQLAELAEMRREAEQARDNCVALWAALSPDDRAAAPLSGTQRAVLELMTTLAALRTTLTRLGRKS